MQLVSQGKADIITTIIDKFEAAASTHDLRDVFLTYPEPPGGIDLETCERSVLEHLSQHLLVARHQFPDSTTLIGIAIPNRDCTIHSNLIRILDGENWSPEDLASAAELQRRTGLFTNMEEERYIHIE